MKFQFSQAELPIAYSMIAAAKSLKASGEDDDPFRQFLYYWMAFNNIYTTIANQSNHPTKLVKNPDESIATVKNGSVEIPKVQTISERKQIALARSGFDDNLKKRLICHDSTMFFLGRTPRWQGKKLSTDASNQRINGVLNVNHTVNSDYPVWSPIDEQSHAQFMANQQNGVPRDLLAKQIVDLLYTVRCNLMHGGKRLDDANDRKVVQKALPLLKMIVQAFACQPTTACEASRHSPAQ